MRIYARFAVYYLPRPPPGEAGADVAVAVGATVCWMLLAPSDTTAATGRLVGMLAIARGINCRGSPRGGGARRAVGGDVDAGDREAVDGAVVGPACGDAVPAPAVAEVEDAPAGASKK